MLDAASHAPVWRATTNDVYDVKNGPMANLGSELITVYKEFAQFSKGGGQGAFRSSLANKIQVSGNLVGIDVKGTGDLAAYQQVLRTLGMHIIATAPSVKVVEGWIPIAQLPALATQAQTVGATPLYINKTSAGSANNQADRTLFADLARNTFGLTGAGQKIGVLSDSVNLVGGGIAASIATGDLPASGVQIIQDQPQVAGFRPPSDEGRAMLEQIYDIAPGATLAFATGLGPGIGPVQFAANVDRLAAAGCTIIVDDITFFADPAFQDGIITDAINRFVAAGGVYLSSAGNSGNSGYLSEFRGTNATVGSIGAGRFMDFDPSAGVSTLLPIQVTSPTDLWLQFSQPFYTTTGVTSDLDIYILNADGSIAAQSNLQNIAGQVPVDFTGTIAPGNYNVAIRVASGPDPSHVTFYDPNQTRTIVSQQFGAGGGTFYPTTFGHNAAPTAIGVGAVPWWFAPPYTNASPVRNEDFSSFGPGLRLFNFDGSIATPTYQLKPDLSAPDGNNTSFFGGDIDTTRTSPSSPTNLDPDLLPNFFGTSSAAPNLAAVVALMKQANPSLTRNQILSALIATATPLNGTAKGVWDQQGGYGLANATAAISAVTQTRVSAISPGVSQTISVSPTSISVLFSRPINFASLQAGDITITGPNGVIVLVGTPVAVDNPNTPTLVRFPITIVRPQNQIANGVYRINIANGAITAADGTAVIGAADSFNLQQTNAPRVVYTAFENRVVGINFSVPLDPNTVNQATVQFVRAGGINGAFNDPSRNVVVSNLPGARVFYYAPTNSIFVDLTAVDPAQLPSDRYAIVVSPAVTDSVGNPLNGAFNGVFPSGTTPATPALFVQDFGNVFAQAPIITNVGLNPLSDSGIKGDQNTNVATPSIVGRILSGSLGTVAGVRIFVQFNGIIHPGQPSGTLNLAPGAGGRGVSGTFDAVAVTDANGFFTILYPPGVAPLPAGLNRVRILAVAPASGGVEGLAATLDTAFRVDQTRPYIGSINGTPVSSIPNNSTINGLTTLTLQVVDPVRPQNIGNPFAVDTRLTVSALDPVSAANISNYALTLAIPDGRGGFTFQDRSSFIASATFTPTTVRTFTTDPYTGFITLSFNSGLQAGRYILTVKTANGTGIGIQDASGNGLSADANASAMSIGSNFVLTFDIQPTPVYITGFAAASPGGVISGPRSVYEIPVAGVPARGVAAPNVFAVDFSTSLRRTNAQGQPINYTNLVRLVRSANSPNGPVDGEFGTLGYGDVGGFTLVPGTTVSLINSVEGAVAGQPGFQNRLLITLPAGASLPADYYRLFIPNRGSDNTAIFDIYGNQLDGEFLGYQNATGKFVNLMPNGQVRGQGAFELPSLSGDGVAGGSFTTGFVVVPNGNIIYARPDYVDDPFISSDDPDGSITKPYAALAPEAIASIANGNDLNSIANFGAGFNFNLDRNGNGRFDRSALFAAQQRTLLNGGPAVVVLQPALAQRNPITGVVSRNTFVLQAPAGPNAIFNDASTSVPALTTLIFGAGSSLKMLNASLFVQNQGSALQILGGPNPDQRVSITSYKDDSVGGDTNNDRSDSTPAPGDYGGLVFRNYTQAGRNSLFPGQIPSTGIAAVDNRLKAVAQQGTGFVLSDAISGADDVLSIINFMTETYGGGGVPATIGTRYDGVTLYNSRPAIVNSSFSRIGQSGALQAAISGDLDSFREDYIGRGPLIRNATFLNNGLNGIYVRAQPNGVAQATNAVVYANNPDNNESFANFTFDDPYPYLLTSRMEIGSQLQVESGGQTFGYANRLYVQPGMIVKFQRGSALEVVSSAASINIGERTYLDAFDLNNSTAPGVAGFRPNKVGDAKVIFTSLYDDVATSFFFDPVTQVTTTVVSALAALVGGAGALQPTANVVSDLARWGGVSIVSGAVAVIDEANFRYGGAPYNSAEGTSRIHVLDLNRENNVGSNVSITNNDFTSNADIAVNLQPNSLVAADPLRPLQSGNPFIHGNVFIRNDINGVGIGDRPDISLAANSSGNLNVNSVWTGGDFTYVLRTSIVVDSGSSPPPTPSATQLLPALTPGIVLTLQSTPAGTVLADGTTVDLPGVPLVVKLQNPIATFPGPDAVNTAGATNNLRGGAGFLVGVDNGADPLGNALIDPGAYDQIRIVGIGANQTTGQSRVPVILTSLRDDTVGTTVRNVVMNRAITNNTIAPAAGDGGIIYFGGNSLSDYNLLDVRDGNVIDNADLRYMSRVEQQGGGIIYTFNIGTGTDTGFGPIGYNSFNPRIPGDPDPAAGGDNIIQQKLGNVFLPNGVGYSTQYNIASKLAISNTNFSSFRDQAVLAHPGYNAIAIAGNYTNDPTTYRAGFAGQPTHTYLYNNTFSNMPNRPAVEIRAGNAANGAFPNPAQAVLLNNTFYNVGTGFLGDGPAEQFRRAHVSALLMDNIFSTTQGPAVTLNGSPSIQTGSNLQYNLFHNIANNAYITGSQNAPNNQPVFGDPLFRDPANGNFNLLPASPAIDAARSEIGPTWFGDMLYPAIRVDANFLTGTPIRNGFDPTATSPFFNSTPVGGFNPIGGISGYSIPQDIVSLAGYPERGFNDQFIAVSSNTPGGTNRPGASNAATFNYVPIAGERDILGNLRVKSPTTSRVGFGSRPFFDIGAYEYIVLNPPSVIAAAASTAASATPVNIYSVGGTAGTNSPPTAIYIGFDQQINPATINASTVLLLASGGDGVFGNGNSQSDGAINLQGRLAFDPLTRVLVINTAGLVTASDEYRIVLKGTGSRVLRNPDGAVLDGENLDAAGNQRALPSGDEFPGGDFQLTFTLDSTAPVITAGTFRLAAASDTSNGRLVTRVVRPTFLGRVTDVFPPVGASAGLTAIVDISTRGDGVFDLLDAGRGVTNANGDFTVTLNRALPNTPVNVGPDGIKGTADDLYSLARLRVIDQSGNASNQITDPLSSYLAKGAVARLIVDTVSPTIDAISPSGNTVAALNPAGQVIITALFSETIDPASLNASTIQVVRAGGDGSFTEGNEVVVPINPATFAFVPQGNVLGGQYVSFALAGPGANDIYAVRFIGTGTNPITDIAKNPLGRDYVNGPFTVFSPALANSLFVYNDPTFFRDLSLPLGSRFNPYRTITEALAASETGDQVLVLPGTYRENVALRSGVRLLSADLSSTDGLYVPGSAQQTLIYGAPSNSTGTSGLVTVAALNLTPVAGIDTEISGFSIIAPLLGNSVTGVLDRTSIGILVQNSDVLISKNYIINAGAGIGVLTSGVNAQTPRIYNNGIIGNFNGVLIRDLSPSSYARLNGTQIVNNTIANNSFGVSNVASASGLNQAIVLNNIFYANHDLDPARNGAGILSGTPLSLAVGFNLFQGNGPSQASSLDDAVGVFAGFDPLTLDSEPDALGNFAGNAAFVAARDPRPNADTPAVFFLDGNYDLSLRSAAIDSALNDIAPLTDFLSRGRVRIDGRGFPNTGPADIGAFEFRGTGGIAAGGQLLRVVTTSLSAEGTARSNAVFDQNQAPTYIDVDLSSNVDPSSVQPSDLVLSGSGLDSNNPAHAVSLVWLDGHTVRFFLAGGFSKSGTVNVNIAEGAITDRTGRPIAAFADTFTIGASTSQNGNVTPGNGSGETPIIQPSTPKGPKGRKARAAAKAKAKAAARAAAKAKAQAAAKAKAKARAAAKAKAAALAKAKAAARAAARLAAKITAREKADGGPGNA